MIVFKQDDSKNEMFLNNFYKEKIPNKQNLRFMSHRDKIKLLKHEKMKYENLQQQHKWKLETHLKKYPKALKAQLNKER
jgi:hypothetical protein